MNKAMLFWKAVNAEADNQSNTHERRAKEFARSGDPSVFQGQPIEGGFVYLASVADRFGFNKGGMVSQVGPYKSAAQLIVEGSMELASEAQINKWHRDMDERRQGYARRDAARNSREFTAQEFNSFSDSTISK